MSAKTPKQLSQLIAYILGRHPEAFGVVLDFDGFVTIKTLLKVLNEEPGWRHVRIGHLNEALLTLQDAGFEMDAQRIRARNREHLPTPEPAAALPKTVFTFIRRKTHLHAVMKGLSGTDAAPIVLCRDRSLAERIGKRLDRSPVPLVVNTAQAQALGASFWTAGDGIFTATEVPVGCFSAPPPPKTSPAAADRKPAPPETARTPGSFIIDAAMITPSGTGTDRKKEGQKKKRRRRAPPWRQ